MASLLLVFSLHCHPHQLSPNLEAEWGKKELLLIFVKVHNEDPCAICLISFILHVEVNTTD